MVKISGMEKALRRPGAFEIGHTDPASAARGGVLWTRHGPVAPPVFMPVGTQGAVKAVAPSELYEADVGILLGNTYHLAVRPGIEIVEAAGGLHRFMGWDRPILTDSGGYQVFSLAGLRKIGPDGVWFQSHVDGRRLFLGPREAMAIQRRLGSDIAMVFDECVPYPSTRDYACQAVTRTLEWAAACALEARADGQLVFGIVQGGEFGDLRERCARELRAIGFDGYAVGGVSVGEPGPVLLKGVEDGVRALPEDRPRYLMGVGLIPQIFEAVARGVDMFDCVMPTRLARNGSAFTRTGRVPIKAGRFKADFRPVEEGCVCYACRHFSRAYVRHLLNAGEILGLRLLTVHNLHRYMELMRDIRESLRAGTFAALKAEWLARYGDDRA